MFIDSVEMAKWAVRIRKLSRKLKTDDLNDFDTDFVDIDILLTMYVDEFRQFKRFN